MRKIAKGAKGNLKDISEQRFGRLIAKHPAYRIRGTVYWYCKCDCGNFTTVRGDVLRGGTTESCGCFSKENAKQVGYANRTHGMTETATYKTFLSMRDRCKNKKLQSYKYYGGRGIKVCQGWDTPAGFPDFLKAVGVRPGPAYSLDRIRVNKHYSCGKCPQCRRRKWKMNVRWAVIEAQANNRRNNRFITWRGETKTLAQWSRWAKIKRSTISHRLKTGWPLWKALTKTVSRHATARLKAKIGGKTRLIVEWAEITGIPAYLFYFRIKRGWSGTNLLSPPRHKS